jgi:predicted methyltransferase
MKTVPAFALMATLVVPPAFGADAAGSGTGSASGDKALQAAVAGDWRSADEKARDRYRHPVESLTFWGLKPGMTLLEVQPGGGWWTDILAPYARATDGKLYVTAADLANPKLSDGAKKARADFEARYAAKPDTFGKLEYVDWGAVSRSLPANTFDLILTARSIHGWMQQGADVAQQTFAEFHKALKPGGILAVEQHRANPTGGAEKPESGYVSEQHVIDLAQKAGFKLAAKSEINANPKDTKDHPFGVWTLPPALYSTPYGSGKPDDPNFDHSKYLAIGESDRMTLKFVK